MVAVTAWGGGATPVGRDMPMIEPSSAIQFEAMLLLRHLNHLHRHSGADAAPLDRSAYVLLTRIELEGPMSIRQLRDALGLDDSTLNRQTAAVVRSGFARRIPDPDGGVARKFALTEQGALRIAQERESYEESFARVLDTWTSVEVDRLTDALRSFNETYELLESRPWPRPSV